MADDALTRRVADELEIRNLVAKLAHLADEGDLDEYLQLFAEDAVWDGGAELGSVKGHPELLAAAKERRASGRSGPGTNSRHVSPRQPSTSRATAPRAAPSSTTT